jgi:hypothetical protein
VHADGIGGREIVGKEALLLEIKDAKNVFNFWSWALAASPAMARQIDVFRLISRHATCTLFV